MKDKINLALVYCTEGTVQEMCYGEVPINYLKELSGITHDQLDAAIEEVYMERLYPVNDEWVIEKIHNAHDDMDFYCDYYIKLSCKEDEKPAETKYTFSLFDFCNDRYDLLDDNCPKEIAEYMFGVLNVNEDAEAEQCALHEIETKVEKAIALRYVAYFHNERGMSKDDIIGVNSHHETVQDYIVSSTLLHMEFFYDFTEEFLSDIHSTEFKNRQYTIEINDEYGRTQRTITIDYIALAKDLMQELDDMFEPTLNIRYWLKRTMENN